MRYSFAGLILFAFSSTALAQSSLTTVPYTFTAGTAAKASEVNADFQALAAAIDTASVSGYEFVQVTGTIPANTTQMAQFLSNCPVGKRVVGGGFSVGGDATVIQSQPVVNTGAVYGWLVGVNNHQSVTFSITVLAICARVHNP